MTAITFTNEVVATLEADAFMAAAFTSEVVTALDGDHLYQ